MTKRRQSGFTIVELIIVIAVIAVLAAITAVFYIGAQKQARDLKNVDGMHKVADSIELFTVKNQHFPLGGWGSTALIGTGTECIDGANGYAGHGMYKCSIEDTLAASGYLPTGFIAALSPNKKSAYTDGRASIMVYSTGATSAMVMASMEDPTADDTAYFNTQLTKCLGSVPGSYAPRDTYGMSIGVCVTYSTP